MCLEMLHLRTLEFQLGFLRAKGRKPHGSKQWDCPSEISELCVCSGWVRVTLRKAVHCMETWKDRSGIQFTSEEQPAQGSLGPSVWSFVFVLSEGLLLADLSRECMLSIGLPLRIIILPTMLGVDTHHK